MDRLLSSQLVLAPFHQPLCCSLTNFPITSCHFHFFFGQEEVQLGQGTPHLWHKGILWNQGRVAGSCTVYRIWLCRWIGSFLLNWSLHHSTSLFVALWPTSQSPVATFTSSLVSLDFRCSKACTSSSLHKNWKPPHAFCRRISSVRHIPLVWCRSSKYTATKQYRRAVKEMVTGLLGASRRAVC